MIPSSTGACGGWCPGGDIGSFGSGGGHGDSLDWTSQGEYFTVTRTTQYQTTAQDGDRIAEITTTVTEKLVVDRNGKIVVPDRSPVVITQAKSVGRNPIGDTELRKIENIVTTAVKLAISSNFSVVILLTILKKETQYGRLPNREGVRRKASEINPGQFSRSSGLGQAVDDQGDGYTTQQALEINIGKTIMKWNDASVQKGNTLNEQFQLYNSESRAKRIAYANSAEASYNTIMASIKTNSRTEGRFFSARRPSFYPIFGIAPCGPLAGCPRY